ncbi:MAG: thioredoxin family protein [Bacteroidales bacterium]
MTRQLIQIIIALCLFLPAQAQKQSEGIRFFHGTFNEALSKAKADQKLVFIDFYTQWCGPCKMMVDEVFPLLEVGNFYNKHFVSIKIDAESGEGVELAKKYKVKSYPTYGFIDPFTKELVHLSGSRQDAEVFIFTGNSAISPSKRSIYLETEYESGNNNSIFLADYLDYLASRNDKDRVTEVLEKITKKPKFSMDTSEGWEVFRKHIKGYTNKYFIYLLDNKEQFVKKFGQKEVEDKMYKEFNYCKEPELIKEAPDFKGRDFLWVKNLAQQHINQKNYEEAAKQINILIESSNDFAAELCIFLRFIAREPLYRETTSFWEQQCLRYAQYVAYNYPDRRDAISHFDYAKLLEHVIRKIPNASLYFPEEITIKPANGKKEYSMRSDALKPKPKK